MKKIKSIMMSTIEGILGILSLLSNRISSLIPRKMLLLLQIFCVMTVIVVGTAICTLIFMGLVAFLVNEFPGYLSIVLLVLTAIVVCSLAVWILILIKEKKERKDT